MILRIECPVCERHDCAAWDEEEDGCIALTDNDFGQRGCPFYKKGAKNEPSFRDRKRNKEAWTKTNK